MSIEHRERLVLPGNDDSQLTQSGTPKPKKLGRPKKTATAIPADQSKLKMQILSNSGPSEYDYYPRNGNMNLSTADTSKP